jgi:hypothetical protein
MRTTSQLAEEISEHATHQPSGKSEHTIRPGIASPEAARGTWRANEVFNRARSLTRPIIGGLFFGALGALAISLISHFAVVVPLERNLLSAEVRGLATDIDAAVRMRSSIISTAATTFVGQLSETGLVIAGEAFTGFSASKPAKTTAQINQGATVCPQDLFSKDPCSALSLNLGIQTTEAFPMTRKATAFSSPVSMWAQKANGLPEADSLESLSPRF